jgi:hypothetical protein
VCGEAFGITSVAAVAVFFAGCEGCPQGDDFGAERFCGGAEFVERCDRFEDGVRLGVDGFKEGAQGFERGGFGPVGARFSESGCGSDLDGGACIIEESRQAVGVFGDGARSSDAEAGGAPVADGWDG